MRYLGPKDAAFANGCEEDLILPEIDKSHIDLKDELMHIYDEEAELLDMVKRKVALRQCRVILSKLVKMHKVFQLDKKGFYEFLHGIDLNENTLTFDELLSIYDKINGFSSYVNPYDIKVGYVKSNNLIEGELLSSVYDTVVDGGIKTVVSFDRINLCGTSTVVSPCVYGHELIHSQLQSNRGIVKRYENVECLSYFIELVIALELSDDEEILRIMEKFVKAELIRLIEGLEKMTEIKDDLYDTGKYLISTIKALKLFILYYKGSPFMRLDMLSRVQKIIDGDMYLEELLDYYGVNEKVDKDLVKHLTR